MLGVSVCESAGLQGRRGYPGMHQMGRRPSQEPQIAAMVREGRPSRRPPLSQAKCAARLAHLTWLCTE